MAAERLTVLVLAGGRLREQMPGPAPLQQRHPVLLPAGSRLALHRIVEFYGRSPLVDEIVVAVDAATPPPSWLTLGGNVRLLPIEPQAHILGTVKASLPAISSHWVQLNPITTLPNREPELACRLEIAHESWPQEDWACLSGNAASGWRFHPKSSGDGTYGFALTGILCAQRAALSAAVEHLPEQAGHDLIYLAETLHESAAAQPVGTAWLDLGHRATFWASRQHQLPSRSFNQVRYCPKRDAICKRSSDRKRLSSEASYLEELPTNLRSLFPQVLDNNGEHGELWLEWVPYPNLAELLLHWQLGRSGWTRIATRLRQVHERLGASGPNRPGNAAALYSTKLRDRWQQLLAEPQMLRGWLDEERRVNGHIVPPLNTLIQDLLERLEPLERCSELGRIHGDLCFNNILCEPLSGALRLIDPRGEPLPGLPRGHGDRRYDLVKLHHSLMGSYDACVNGLFRLQQHGEALQLELHTATDQHWIQQLFAREVFAPLEGEALNTLSASLFFSMLPLHQDDPERQLALAAIGALLMQDAMPDGANR